MDTVRKLKEEVERAREAGYIGVGLITLCDNIITPEVIAEFKKEKPEYCAALGTDEMIKNALGLMARSRI